VGDLQDRVSKVQVSRNYRSMSALFGSSLAQLRKPSNGGRSASQGSIYDECRFSAPPSFDKIQQNWKVLQQVTSQIQGYATDTSDQSTQAATWSGWLFKKSNGLLGSWKARWFEIVPPPQAESGEGQLAHLSGAVIIYQSETKGEQHLHVSDVRREHLLDSGSRIGLSIGFTTTRTDSKAVPARSGSGQRMHLMAATDLDAVAFLSCLRSILEPGRAWPSVRDAIHFPAKILRELE
jgi:hypothetical protein